MWLHSLYGHMYFIVTSYALCFDNATTKEAIRESRSIKMLLRILQRTGLITNNGTEAGYYCRSKTTELAS